MTEYRFMQADKTDKAEILALYESLWDMLGSTWGEEYPSEETLEQDFSQNGVFILRDGDRIIAVISAGDDADNDGADGNWQLGGKYFYLSRLGVSKGFQGKGLASLMVTKSIEEMKRRGYETARLLVAKENPTAQRIYQRLGFKICNETNYYDIDFYCEELKL